MLCRRILACCVMFWVLLASSLAPAADSVVFKSTAQGKPDLKSIDVLGFAPEGVLLIGDGRGSQVIAVETNDATWQGGLETKIENIAARLAERLGAAADGIEMIDVATNPASGTVYIAVRKQDDKAYAILTVNKAGKIGELELDNVKYARAALDGGTSPVTKVTDVAWADDRVLASGRAAETFASKIFSIAAPLKHDDQGQIYSAETYHVSHGKWETNAPMSVMIPFRENDQTYVIGAFSCTPIVKYPVSAVQPGAQVKGTSVLELGSGNRPIDMFVYEKDGSVWVLSNTFRFHHDRRPVGPSPYWTVKFKQGILAEAEAVNEKALRRVKGDPAVSTPELGVIVVDSFHGVMQMDKLDDQRAIVLREGKEGVDLEPLPLP